MTCSIRQDSIPRVPAESTAARITIRGRSFAPEEILQIKALVEASPDDHRFALSKKVCAALGWVQPNGRLKDRSCRDVLRRLQQLGFFRLPAPRRPPVKRRRIPLTIRTAPGVALCVRPRSIGLASLSVVTGCGDPQKERLWNEYVERYHFLGFGVPLGPHIKYFITLGAEPVACLAFAGAAWRVQVRDQWIGWSDEQRRRNLRYVVNNTRFVIFPWVNVPNLASRVLGLVARRIQDDWLLRYAYRPLLLETFVDTQRHVGTCFHEKVPSSQREFVICGRS